MIIKDDTFWQDRSIATQAFANDDEHEDTSRAAPFASFYLLQSRTFY